MSIIAIFLFFPSLFSAKGKETNRLSAVWNSENTSTLHEVSREAFYGKSRWQKIVKMWNYTPFFIAAKNGYENHSFINNTPKKVAYFRRRQFQK